ncbi:type II secretion system F family protein [Aeoliella mucimassa]|uniref:Type II secretion system protein F n=1 Tax=Aeoliella mucimassa TaxID=2527972 RepID=A0A518AH54_9BACT|nr:type II secretion system F family protein [Aeoliella mucimassa]QDU54057.1 Type II secretion system protein F [Aeoliella mucimassa]
MAKDTSPTLDDFAALNAELASLVRARMPLEPSLRQIARYLPTGAADMAERLAKRLEQGMSLGDAIELEGKKLPEMYLAVISAGLESGEPAGALEAVSQSAARLATLRQTTGIALIVPVMVVVIASALFGFLLQMALLNN